MWWVCMDGVSGWCAEGEWWVGVCGGRVYVVYARNMTVEIIWKNMTVIESQLRTLSVCVSVMVACECLCVCRRSDAARGQDGVS